MKPIKPATKKKLTKEQQRLVDEALTHLFAELQSIKNLADNRLLYHSKISHATISLIDAETISQSKAYADLIAGMPTLIANRIKEMLPEKLTAETKRLKKKMLVGKVLSKCSDAESAEFEKMFYIGDLK